MHLDQTELINVRQKLAVRLHRLTPIEAGLEILLALVGAGIAFWLTRSQPILIVAAALVLLYVIRFVLSRAAGNDTQVSEHTERWLKLFEIPSIITGGLWGALAGLTAMSESSLAAGVVYFAGALASVINVQLFAGSVTATVGFSLLALLAPAAVFAVQLTPTSLAMATMGTLVFVIVAFESRFLRQMIWENMMLRHETGQLTSHLDQRRTQVEKLNVALKTTMDKREQVELELRKTAADLGLVQGKAKALADTLERVTPYCPVTGLANARAFREQLDTEWRREMRERKPLSLIVVALDAYEEYLNTYGRQSADALLKRLASTVKAAGKRATDQAGRFGEHQIALSLPGADLRSCSRIAEGLRARIESQKVAHAGAQNRNIVTVHVGAVTMIPSRTAPVDELLKRVESSLYEAKFQGGDKVVIYQPLDKIKLRKWNRTDDGPLNEQSLIQKLLLWGYDTERAVFPAASQLGDRVAKHETVIALLTGQIAMLVEGTEITVKAGDSVFIPAGTTYGGEVIGDTPVITFTAERSN